MFTYIKLDCLHATSGVYFMLQNLRLGLYSHLLHPPFIQPFIAVSGLQIYIYAFDLIEHLLYEMDLCHVIVLLTTEQELGNIMIFESVLSELSKCMS